jgi:hypothetical protein
MWVLTTSLLWLLCMPCSTLIVRELESLIYTSAEIDIRRIEKHVGLWNFDLKRHFEKGAKLESLLAARRMRESILLVRTLLSYATRTGDSEGLSDSSSRKKISISIVPEVPPSSALRDHFCPFSPQGEGSSMRKTSWAGERLIVEEESNRVRRVKRTTFREILHQLTGVATDAELQQ